MAPLCPVDRERFDVFSRERFSGQWSAHLSKLPSCSNAAPSPPSSPTASPSSGWSNHQQPYGPQQQRRVQFDESCNRVYHDRVVPPLALSPLSIAEQDNSIDVDHDHDDSDEEVASSRRWWSNTELETIRGEAKAISSRIRNNNNSPLRPSMDSDYDLAMAHRKTTLVLAADFASLLKLPPTTPDQDLARWCAIDDGRRGLERFASKIYCCFRRRDVTESRMAVLMEQERQRSIGVPDDELLAHRCSQTTRRARNFALFFGGADAQEALALREADHSNNNNNNNNNNHSIDAKTAHGDDGHNHDCDGSPKREAADDRLVRRTAPPRKKSKTYSPAA